MATVPNGFIGFTALQFWFWDYTFCRVSGMGSFGHSSGLSVRDNSLALRRSVIT